MGPNQPLETVFRTTVDEVETNVEALKVSSPVEVESVAAPAEEPCTEEKAGDAEGEQEVEEEEEDPEVPLSGAAARKAAAQRVKFNASRGSSGKKADPKLAARKAHLDALLHKNPDEVVEKDCDAAHPGPVKLTFEDLKRMDKEKVKGFRMQEEFGSRVRIKP